MVVRRNEGEAVSRYTLAMVGPTSVFWWGAQLLACWDFFLFRGVFFFPAVYLWMGEALGRAPHLFLEGINSGAERLMLWLNVFANIHVVQTVSMCN